MPISRRRPRPPVPSRPSARPRRRSTPASRRGRPSSRAPSLQARPSPAVPGLERRPMDWTRRRALEGSRRLSRRREGDEVVARIDRQRDVQRIRAQRRAVDLNLGARGCRRRGRHREPVQPWLERGRALGRDVCALVVSIARQLLGLAKLAPRAGRAPRSLVAIREIERDADGRREPLALGEFRARLGVAAGATQLHGLGETCVRARSVGAGLGLRDGRVRERDECDREGRDPGCTSPDHSRPPNSPAPTACGMTVGFATANAGVVDAGRAVTTGTADGSTCTTTAESRPRSCSERSGSFGPRQPGVQASRWARAETGAVATGGCWASTVGALATASVGIGPRVVAGKATGAFAGVAVGPEDESL